MIPLKEDLPLLKSRQSPGTCCCCFDPDFGRSGRKGVEFTVPIQRAQTDSKHEEVV